MSRPRTSRVLTKEDKDFIRENYKELQVIKLAKKFEVSTRTVYRFLNDEGLKSLDASRKIIVREKKIAAASDMFDWKDFQNSVI